MPAKTAKKAPTTTPKRETRKEQSVKDVWNKFKDFATSFMKKAGYIYVPEKKNWIKYEKEVGEEEVVRTALWIKLGTTRLSKVWDEDLTKLPWKFLTDETSFMRDAKKRSAFYDLLTQTRFKRLGLTGEYLHVNVTNDEVRLQVEFKIHNPDSNDEFILHIVLSKKHEGSVFSSKDIDRIVTLAKEEVKDLRESLHSPMDHVPASMFVPLVGMTKSCASMRIADLSIERLDRFEPQVIEIAESAPPTQPTCCVQ